MTDNHIENNAAREVAARKYILFSVTAPDWSATVRAFVRDKVRFKSISGMYGGKEERSFVVNADQWAAVWRAVSWAIQRQESILHLGPVDRARDARPVVLEYVETTRPPEFLGYWFAVSKETALARDGWTCDGGQYYVAALTRPDHIKPAGEDWKAAIEASHDTVRASNRAAVNYHIMVDGRGRGEVAGYFSPTGKALTPSGHEF